MNSLLALSGSLGPERAQSLAFSKAKTVAMVYEANDGEKLLHHINQKHNRKLIVSGAKFEANDGENFKQWGNNRSWMFSLDTQ